MGTVALVGNGKIRQDFLLNPKALCAIGGGRLGRSPSPGARTEHQAETIFTDDTYNAMR
jgi:hypothetical protein